MFIALEAEAFCPCGQPVKVDMCGTARVNKRSLRVTGPLLGALEHSECPSCGKALRDGEPLERTPYRVCSEDAAKIVEYRMRKWGVSDAPGPLVEAQRRAS